MQVSIDLPDVYFSFYDKPTLVKELQLSLALILFKQSKVSITKEICVVTDSSRNEIPVINISVEEQNEEWNNLKKEFL